MKFGVFYEHQLPRPWEEGDEQKLFHDALDQVELADQLGLDYAWEVEHHFLEEYSHSSAPEVFLAACSQRTKNIRLGHGITVMPPAYNPPFRVAERIATLDIVSKGRVDFGTGESASRVELEGFGVDPADKYDMWRESTEQVANMLAMSPYPGFEGKHFSAPCRNVVPKPVQKPHPPMWMACSSREASKTAARHGLGALSFAFVEPHEAKRWVDDYYETLVTEGVPIGHAINPNIAIVMGFSCAETEEEAQRRGLDGFRFFGYALGHYYGFGSHRPSLTNVWEQFEGARHLMEGASSPGIGTPDQLTEQLRGYEEAGIDQVIFIQQGGRNRHEDICASLELFASRVMPDFKARDEALRNRRLATLEPQLEQVMARKTPMAEIAESDIPEVKAYGREADSSGEISGSGLEVPLEDPAS